MENGATSQLAALSHPQRLAVFRLLMRRYPDDVPAGEIGRALNLKASTASVYLSALLENRLVSRTRRGTSLLYRANADSAGSLVRYLYNDCCRGRPDLCASDPHHLRAASQSKKNVLFVCTGNSARSIIAEAVLRHQAGNRFNIHSAGADPACGVHPFALRLLQSKGMDTTMLCPKHIRDFRADDAPVFDFIFTVCDDAANGDCPAWPGHPVCAHWGLPDPAAAEGTGAVSEHRFQRTFDALRRRTGLFAALPLERLERPAVQARVDEIGKTPETT